MEYAMDLVPIFYLLSSSFHLPPFASLHLCASALIPDRGGRLSSNRSVQPILRLVVFGDGSDIIRASLSQRLLGLDVFEHDPDAELLALPGQPQRFRGRGQVAFGQANLG